MNPPYAGSGLDHPGRHSRRRVPAPLGLPALILLPVVVIAIVAGVAFYHRPL